MKPVKTERANQILNPPPGSEEWCNQVWVERTVYQISPERSVPAVKLTFELDPNDLADLLKGGRVELMIIGADKPPVSLSVVPGPPVANLAAR